MTIGADLAISLRVTSVALLAFVPMLLEARLAARHERLLRARGGVEPDGDVYPLMQVAYPGVFLAMLLEDISRDGQVSPSRLTIGLVLFLCGKAMKWWAMATLGPFWTFRIIVVPDSAPVRSGPYRFVSHPNYLGVVGELIGAACMTNSAIAGPFGVVVFSVLMLRRVSVENRVRDAILRRT